MSGYSPEASWIIMGLVVAGSAIIGWIIEKIG
jgi:hypothetical protein